MSKTWTARDCYGKRGVWAMAKCWKCGEQTPVRVGSTGEPECAECGPPEQREGQRRAMQKVLNQVSQ